MFSRYSSSASASGMPPPFRPQGNPSPVSPGDNTFAREQYSTTGPHLSRKGFSQFGHPYHQPHIPHSPSSTVSTSLDSSFTRMSSTSNMYNVSNPPMELGNSSQFSYASQNVPPFEPTRVLHSLIDLRRTPITPTIQAKVDKGFFKADQDWTCYRRNYFSVACSYSLSPETEANSGELYLHRSNVLPSEPIEALGVCISAKADGDEGKPIELVQHTPKRDKGPMDIPQIQELSPHLSGNLGVFQPTNTAVNPTSQGLPEFEPSFPGQQGVNVATFDRIQFKKATANNGKRRAAQQYFHILVELYAKVPKGQSESQWVRIASRLSAPMVVRGRSPGHYQDERRNSSTSLGPGGSSGDGGGGGGGTRDPGSSGPGTSHNGNSMPGMSYASSSRIGGGGYQSHATLQRSPSGNTSMPSSTSSSHGSGRSFPERLPDPNLTVEESTNIENFPGYQYYPSTLYETQGPAERPSIPNVVLGAFKVEGPQQSASHDNPFNYGVGVAAGQDSQSQGRTLNKGEQYRRENSGSFQAFQSPTFGDHWHAGSSSQGIAANRDCRRFQGFPASQGFYPQQPAM